MKTNGLTELARLDLQARQAAHPNVPLFAIVRRKFSDKTANDLTKSIVRCFELHNHFSTRLASTGSYRADLGKFVTNDFDSFYEWFQALIPPADEADLLPFGPAHSQL